MAEGGPESVKDIRGDSEKLKENGLEQKRTYSLFNPNVVRFFDQMPGGKLHFSSQYKRTNQNFQGIKMSVRASYNLKLNVN